jgi:hypothetical protein
MTAVMRAVSQRQGPKLLRVAVVHAGKIVDERVIRDRSSITIGSHESATFPLPAGLDCFTLFERSGDGYSLNFTADMRGRVALATGPCDLRELAAQAKVVRERGEAFHRVTLHEAARGKIVIGDSTLLFQFVVAPPKQARPQLPMSVQKGWAGDIDWFTTVIASFSFLMHFFAVSLVYSDWRDPVSPDDDAVVSNLVESVKSLPPPPVAEKPLTVPTATTGAASVEGPTKSPVASADRSSGNGSSQRPGPGTDSGEKKSGPAKTDNLVAALDEFDHGVIGAFDASGRPAIRGVFESGDVPSGLIDEAARRDSHADAGDPFGLKLGDGRRADVGPLARDGADRNIGDRKSSNDSAVTEGKTVVQKGPDGTLTVTPVPPPQECAVNNAQAVVSRMRGRFRACYMGPQGLGSNPDMAGSVTLVATLGPNGEVRSVGGGGGPLAPIVPCLKSVVQSGGFSPPACGAAVISIPISVFPTK